VDDGAGDGPRLRTNARGQPLVTSQDDTEGAGGSSTATAAYEQPLAGGRLQLNGRLQTNHYDYRDDDHLIFPRVGRQFTLNRTDGFQSEAGVHYSRALGPRTTWEARIIQQIRQTSFGSRYADDSSNSDFANDRTVGETIARAEATFAMSPRLSFQVGTEGAWNWLKSESVYNANGAPVVLPAAKVRVEEKRGEMFATSTWKPAPTLNLEAGVRMEGSIISSAGDVTLKKSLYFPKPRFAATWSPRPNTQVRFRVEREVGQLNFDDFVASSSLAVGTVSAGNPDLNPQTAWAVEAAFEQRFWSGGAFVATFKHAVLSDVVDRAPVFGPSGPFDAPANIGDGMRNDLTINLSLPLDRLWIKRGLLKGKALWRWSEVTDPASGLRREISNLQPSEWQLQFSQDLPGWKANWGLDVYSGWRRRQFLFNEVQTTKLKHYVLLYGEVRPQPSLNLRIELANASARGLERIREVYPTVGRLGDPDYVDAVNWGFGRIVFVRVRKPFG
ncbi:MAG: TonB-dependent receptor, partial [Caulobacteraceae bacterium]